MRYSSLEFDKKTVDMLNHRVGVGYIHSKCQWKFQYHLDELLNFRSVLEFPNRCKWIPSVCLVLLVTKFCESFTRFVILFWVSLFYLIIFEYVNNHNYICILIEIVPEKFIKSDKCAMKLQPCLKPYSGWIDRFVRFNYQNQPYDFWKY